jgi:hypothetical protein
MLIKRKSPGRALMQAAMKHPSMMDQDQDHSKHSSDVSQVTFGNKK